MLSKLIEQFTFIFEGKAVELPEQEVKSIVEKNIQCSEDETIDLSDKYFQNWAENLLHLTNENLFDTTVHYFSIFTKVIDVIPSYFPPDSQIFLFIVQSFLKQVIKNDELMNNFRLSFCHKIQLLICSNITTVDYSQIDLVLTICKSLHITDPLFEEIYQYPFNFSGNINLDPSKQVFEYTKLSFTRYLLAGQLLYHILKSSDEKSVEFINNILHVVFNQLITSKMHSLTVDVNPPLGKLLTTPFISWICDEYRTQRIQKNKSTKYTFNLSQIYEACGSYIYDEILKFSRNKNDEIGSILYLIENLSIHYEKVFEKVPGAMNYLESCIREALNDSRMKFAYNLALYIDNLVEDSFSDGSSFWLKLIAFPEEEKECNCGCKTSLQNNETVARSSLLRAVMRIENKSCFCSYLADSINSLAAANGPKIIDTIIQPIMNIIQLTTTVNLLSYGSSNHHKHSCDHNHHQEKETVNNDEETINHNHKETVNNNEETINHNHKETVNNNEETINHNHHEKETVNSSDEIDNEHAKNAGYDHSHCCCCCDSSQNNNAHIYVEATLEFGGKLTSVYCDYLTFQILSVIGQHENITLEDIQNSIDGKDEDIENRVITLSDYLIIQNDDGGYSLDGTYNPNSNIVRIPPFYEEMRGEMEPERHELVKQKMLAAIETKGFESLDFFITDSFVMLNRKVRPDTAMILDTLDEFINEGKVTLEDGVVKYIKEKDENEENKEE